MLERVSGGVAEGSGDRVRGDAFVAYTVMDPEYVHRLPDEVGVLFYWPPIFLGIATKAHLYSLLHHRLKSNLRLPVMYS